MLRNDSYENSDEHHNSNFLSIDSKLEPTDSIEIDNIVGPVLLKNNRKIKIRPSHQFNNNHKSEDLSITTSLTSETSVENWILDSSKDLLDAEIDHPKIEEEYYDQINKTICQSQQNNTCEKEKVLQRDSFISIDQANDMSTINRCKSENHQSLFLEKKYQLNKKFERSISNSNPVQNRIGLYVDSSQQPDAMAKRKQSFIQKMITIPSKHGQERGLSIKKRIRTIKRKKLSSSTDRLDSKSTEKVGNSRSRDHSLDPKHNSLDRNVLKVNPAKLSYKSREASLTNLQQDMTGAPDETSANNKTNSFANQTSEFIYNSLKPQKSINSNSTKSKSRSKSKSKPNLHETCVRTKTLEDLKNQTKMKSLGNLETTALSFRSNNKSPSPNRSQRVTKVERRRNLDCEQKYKPHSIEPLNRSRTSVQKVKVTRVKSSELSNTPSYETSENLKFTEMQSHKSEPLDIRGRSGQQDSELATSELTSDAFPCYDSKPKEKPLPISATKYHKKKLTKTSRPASPEKPASTSNQLATELPDLESFMKYKMDYYDAKFNKSEQKLRHHQSFSRSDKSFACETVNRDFANQSQNFVDSATDIELETSDRLDTTHDFEAISLHRDTCTSAYDSGKEISNLSEDPLSDHNLKSSSGLLDPPENNRDGISPNENGPNTRKHSLVKKRKSINQLNMNSTHILANKTKQILEKTGSSSSENSVESGIDESLRVHLRDKSLSLKSSLHDRNFKRFTSSSFSNNGAVSEKYKLDRHSTCLQSSNSSAGELDKNLRAQLHPKLLLTRSARQVNPEIVNKLSLADPTKAYSLEKTSSSSIHSIQQPKIGKVGMMKWKGTNKNRSFVIKNDKN